MALCGLDSVVSTVAASPKNKSKGRAFFGWTNHLACGWTQAADVSVWGSKGPIRGNCNEPLTVDVVASTPLEASSA